MSGGAERGRPGDALCLSVSLPRPPSLSDSLSLSLSHFASLSLSFSLSFAIPLFLSFPLSQVELNVGDRVTLKPEVPGAVAGIAASMQASLHPTPFAYRLPTETKSRVERLKAKVETLST